MEVAKVTSKGQITIPISIRRRLGINEGDKVLFIYKAEGVMMVNPNTLQGDAGMDIMKTMETAPEVGASTKDTEQEKKPVPSEPVKADDTASAQHTGTPQAAPQTASQSAPETAPKAAPQAETSVQNRPVPPPVEEPEKPDAHVGGFNLNTLLDDIRSIGSNI